MPLNKKTKTADGWTPVRVRREWLNVVREAGELQPKASPTLDLTTCSEPKLLEYACKVACSYILGWLDPVREKELKELEDAHKLKTANVVAKVFGGFGHAGIRRVDLHCREREGNLLSLLGYEYRGGSFLSQERQARREKRAARENALNGPSLESV